MFSKRSSGSNEEPARRRRITDEDTPSQAQNSSFKRNQTLSSYRHNTPDESSRQKVHHLALQRRRIGGVFGIVAIVVVAVALLIWQLIAQVHVTTSTKQLSASFSGAAYEQSINEYLGLNPAQRLRVSLDEVALSDFVSAALPEVESLEMSGMPGIAKGSFAITFRTPVAGWQINGKQYYVDASGVVFEKNYYDAPAVQIVDESGVSPEQGSAVVGSRLLGFLGRIVSQAQGRGYIITKALLPRDTTRQVDVELQGISTRVKFSIDRGAGEQAEDMDRSLKFLKERGIGAEYVDVRVSGRAAYK